MFEFVEIDIKKIHEEIKKGYEEIMQVKLNEGDPASDFICWITYIVALIENKINYTGNMNLLKFSEGKFLDAIGEFVGVKRIESQGAKTRVKYTFSKIFSEVITIPAGHKVSDGNMYFELDNAIELPIGQREIIGNVTCVTSGTIGNDIEKGKINTVVDDIPFLMTVENLEKTTGGMDFESDDKLRTRIHLKPTAFSTAGPKSAYEYYVISSQSNIIDVNVYTLESNPGTVNIIPLLDGGKIPEQQILKKIEQTLDDEVRPFTDHIVVKAPEVIKYDINFKWWARQGDNITLVTERVAEAVQTYVKWQHEKLGRDINPDKLVQLLINAGAKRVEITSPIFKKLDRTKVAQMNSNNIMYQGVEDE